MTGHDGLPVWAARLKKLIQESFDFIGSTTEHLQTRAVVRGIPVRDGDNRVVYRYGTRGELVTSDMVEDFRDIIGRARSVLDIAMSTAVTAAANPPLTPAQQRNTYFPIAATEAQWKSMLGQPHLKVLSRAQLNALREVQPFVTGSQIIAEFSKVHNKDKHELPLKLEVIADPEFVMIFEHIRPLPRFTQHTVEWVDPIPAVENRVEFVTYTSPVPIETVDIERIPIALAIRVDGVWRDIVHLLWDLIEFTERAAAILGSGDTALADLLKAYFDAEHAQLVQFRALFKSKDPEASERDWKRLANESSAARARLQAWAPKSGMTTKGITVTGR